MASSDVNANQADTQASKPSPHTNGTLQNAKIPPVTTGYNAINRSCGNKVLVSIPLLNVLISMVFVVASFFYAYNRKGMKFIAADNEVAFISEIGNEKPESSLFTLGMILASFCSLGTILVRFFQVKHAYVRLDRKFNNATLVVGLLLVLGKVMLSSFQLSSQNATHLVGAGIYVLFACIYAAMQTLITVKNRLVLGRVKQLMCISRVLLTAGMVVGMLIFLIFLHPDLLKFNKKKLSVGQGGEWFFACCKMLFMLTFAVDFWHLHPRLLLIKPNEQIINDLVLSNLQSEREAAEANGTANPQTIDISPNGVEPFILGAEGLVFQNNAALSKNDQPYTSRDTQKVHFTIEEE